MMKQRCLKIAAFLIAITLSNMSTTASAAGSGCTSISNFNVPPSVPIFEGFPLDQVCVYVTGQGLHVEDVVAKVFAVSPICNTRLYITFFDINNIQYEQRIGPD